MDWDLIIFDCDGVLVDSEPLSARTYAALLTEHGLPTTPEEAFVTFLGRARADNQAAIERRLGGPLPATFYAHFYERLYATFRAELQAVPGVAAVLDQLTVPWCVASGSQPATLEISLGATGLLERSRGRIFSAQDVARGKPCPDLFLYAAERMGVEPYRCAVVEDSLPGVQAGIAAGMTVFGYAPQGSGDALAAARAVVFSHMDELIGLLGAHRR